MIDIPIPRPTFVPTVWIRASVPLAGRAEEKGIRREKRRRRVREEIVMVFTMCSSKRVRLSGN